MFESLTIFLVTGSEEPMLAVRLPVVAEMGIARFHNVFSNQSINNRGSLKRGGARKRVASLPLLILKKQKKDSC